MEFSLQKNHAGRKSACGREMGNNEFSWSGLMYLGVLCRNQLHTGARVQKLTVPPCARILSHIGHPIHVLAAEHSHCCMLPFVVYLFFFV